MTSKPTTPPRSIALEVRIQAPREAAWRALTEPEAIARWFPPVVQGKAGPGEALVFSWGGGMDWTTRVVAWEPGEHLTWQDAAGEGPDAPPPMAVDWTLEAQGGAVTVRLVQSGFGEGDSWDAMYDGLTQGWRFFLWALKHALEVHPGTPRRMVSARRPVPADATVAWERILGADGLAAATPLAEGAPLRLRLGDQQLVGTVAGMRAPTHLWGELESLGRATLLVEVEGGYPQRHLGLWLSTYGLSEAQVAPLEQALTALADRALGGLLPG